MIRRTFQIILTLLLLLMVSIVGLIYYLRNTGLTVELTQAQLQAQVEDFFPITHNLPQGVEVTLTEPLVILEEETNRLNYRMNATASIPPFPVKHSGTIQLSGVLRYDPLRYEFFLDDSRIEELNFPGLPAALRPRVEEIADRLASLHLDRRPIYQLEGPFSGDGWLAILPPVELRNLAIENGRMKLHIVLSL